MRVMAALGRTHYHTVGRPVPAEKQREYVRPACDRPTPDAEKHELTISHGNGQQAGLPAPEEPAYEEVPESPLDVTGKEIQGMTGRLAEQEPENGVPFDKPLASLVTMIEADPGHPGHPGLHRPEHLDRPALRLGQRDPCRLPATSWSTPELPKGWR
jgi:carbamate kinase